MGCAEQIMLEVQWLLNYRDDWDRAERRLGELAIGLADISQGEPSQDEDGSGALAVKSGIGSSSRRSTRCR